MADLVHQLIFESADRVADRPALKYRDDVLTYQRFAAEVRAFAAAMMEAGLERCERVAVYADKRIETIVSMFGASAAGAVYVPVNPLLKAEQVAYILADCNVRILVTSPERLPVLLAALERCPDLKLI